MSTAKLFARGFVPGLALGIAAGSVRARDTFEARQFIPPTSAEERATMRANGGGHRGTRRVELGSMHSCWCSARGAEMRGFVVRACERAEAHPESLIVVERRHGRAAFEWLVGVPPHIACYAFTKDDYDELRQQEWPSATPLQAEAGSSEPLRAFLRAHTATPASVSNVIFS